LHPLHPKSCLIADNFTTRALFWRFRTNLVMCTQ